MTSLSREIRCLSLRAYSFYGSLYDAVRNARNTLTRLLIVVIWLQILQIVAITIAFFLNR